VLESVKEETDSGDGVACREAVATREYVRSDTVIEVARRGGNVSKR